MENTDISGAATILNGITHIQQEPTLTELYAARRRRESPNITVVPAARPPPTLPEAEGRLREALNVYIRTRDASKSAYDPSIPRIRGMWIMSPTEDGRGLRENAAGSMLEVTSDIEIRDTASDCPWPYWVYKNHVDHELAKGENCPIKGVPLASCLIVSVSMNCGHMFDHASIVTWASRKPDFSCPVCRTPIAGLWHIRSSR